MNKLIEITNLTVGYENKPDVLKNVSLTIYDDDFLGVIGPNGGGKTTLLKTVLGLITPDAGTVRFFEGERQVPSLNIGYLPQINQIDRKFPISVSEVILSGLTLRKQLFRRYSADDKQRVREVAGRLGISELLPRAIGELSGGQLQRVLLGRAIIDNPKLIILDEPSTYVDKLFETNFYKLLGDINREIAIMLVSHDVGTIISLVKNIACVNQGLHYHSGSGISQEWLNNAYDSCPIELLGHGSLPHRVLMQHDHDETAPHTHSHD
ncbi:MAG: ABC transporter ATP-binding protein [Proteiniphilum sp.]|jgi:zinc transport system ATP-binding protein|nr:ABC transporter ATP-binding protein [Proteiniphilum sp.]MDD2727217.1 ABC transporter ATP-binding protein [Proteiniphilum sp.]MDD3333041.1 ABC transporter ATP-binding protein [Proteiniphilum sp.]MDD3556071.1 ABC transporter ATP-binding protein [Proteiniphilum sp.]MDD3979940.1 ABC transporter ATP-binding protein [Proteiniphilum sp.]